MDRQFLLQEANKLVSSGLRKSAIDLLNEYLELYPTDPFVVSALGRIYLLEKKPDQAIKYLQLSLSLRNDKVFSVNNEVTNSFYNLDKDDLNYIEISAIENEQEYFYENEDVIQCPEISKDFCKQEVNNRIIEIKDNFESQSPSEYSLKASEEEPAIENTFEIEFDGKEEYWSNNSVNEFKSTQVIDDEEFDSFYSLDVFETLYYDEIAELPHFDDEYEDDDIVEEVSANNEEKSLDDEFDWYVVEDFDDIDEPDIAPYLQDYLVAIDGKVSRIDRAGQIAAEVIQAYDWGTQNIGLLQQVFYENGWAAARVAIEHELARGLTPDELELAIFVRTLWTENHQYWISFHRITSNQAAQQTDAANKRMSWREALRIIRVFNSLPSEEEIQLFIDDIYYDWYCSSSLQKQYKAFIRYLKYRTGSVRRTLPANEWFSFVAAYEDDTLIELSRDEIRQAYGVHSLKQQDIDLEKILQDVEQKYNVIKPPIKYEDNFYLMQVSEIEGKYNSTSKPKAILDQDYDLEVDIEESKQLLASVPDVVHLN